MSALVYVFNSTDQGAPALSGTVGTMIALLDAVLVDGYGSVAVSSAARSGSTVTVTTSAPHGFSMLGTVGPVVQISGAVESQYNGKWRITGVSSSTIFTFDIGAATPTSPASGSITSKRAPLGWTKAYTGTNKAAYKMPVGSNGFYLRVDDSAPAVTSARQALCRGYETMSDIDTGTGPFPTIAQAASGVPVSKSQTADSTARPWCVIADELMLTVMTVPLNGATDFFPQLQFGDFPSYKSGDLFNTICLGGESVATGAPNGGATSFISMVSSFFGGVESNSYIARTYNQLGSAIQFAKLSTGTTLMGVNGMPFPAPLNNGLFVSPPIFILESALIRGVMPGLYYPMHNSPAFSDGAVIQNAVNYPGRCFLGKRLRSTSTTGYQCLFDITGPWR